MNRAHDGVFFLSSFKNEKETSKFNYVAMGALEGALVNVIEAAEQTKHLGLFLCCAMEALIDEGRQKKI